MKKILFICLGNICRSPAADGIMKHLVSERGLDDEFLIDSAGIGSWHVGQLPDRRMRQCGERHGYTFDHRARQFSARDFARFDLIAVMDQENYHDVARQANSPADLQKIIRMSDYLRHLQAKRPSPTLTTVPSATSSSPSNCLRMPARVCLMNYLVSLSNGFICNKLP